MTIATQLIEIGKRARAASRTLAATQSADRNRVLEAIAGVIDARRADLRAANEADLSKARADGLADAMIDRLALTEKGIDTMIASLHQMIALPDPIGSIDQLRSVPSGISVGRMRVPLGVVGIIYEARPNVTIDAAALCLKSGNATILRGGKEAIQSNLALAQSIAIALAQTGLSEHCVQVLETVDRSAVDALVSMPEYVDVIIPRGGKGLIERIMQTAKVPVIKHLDGNCHIYIDAYADSEKSVNLVENSKTQRYGTCNTLESLLLERTVAQSHLPQIAQRLQKHEVELRACPEALQILRAAQYPQQWLKEAKQEDWSAEYLAPVLAVKIVNDLDEAISHINTFSSGHTESIVTEHHGHAMRFLREIDSASVMINASTRFADGFEYGLGAEIGISTDKFHARGPVGLEGLTSQKWIVLGDGHVRR